MKRTRHGVVFRYRFRPRPRWWMVGICGLLSIVLFLIARRFLPLPLDDPMRQIGGFAAAALCFSAMFFVFGLIIPQWLLRVTPIKIQYARRWFFNKRIAIRWDQVERLRWLSGPREVRSGTKVIHVGMASGRQSASPRSEATVHLARYFDLDAPTRYEQRMQRQRKWTMGRKILDRIVMVTGVLVIFGLLLALMATGARLPHSNWVPVVGILGLAAECIFVPKLLRWMMHESEQWKEPVAISPR